jgi:hypothetical protein
VVLAWQIDDKPRRGLYGLRPMGMSECYYADLTAIEINGVPVPTIGMDKPVSAQPGEAPPSAVARSQEAPARSSLPPQPPQPVPAQREEGVAGEKVVAQEKPITAEDCKSLPGGIEGLKTATLQRYQKCLAMYGGEQSMELSPEIGGFASMRQ